MHPAGGGALEPVTIHELAPGEIFELGYELAGDRYVEFAVDQLEGDLLVRLFDVAGGELSRSDLPGRRSLTERIAASVETAGSYSLRIELAAGAPARARFAVHKLIDRPAAGRDVRRVEAIGLFQDGLRLGDENVEASSREAIGRFQRSAELFGDIDAKTWRGRVLMELAGVQKSVGDVEPAREAFEIAVALLRESPDRRVLADALTRFGWLLDSLGEIQEGLRHCEEALVIARSLGARDLEASALNNLGVLRFRLGEMDEAVGHFERVVALRRVLGGIDLSTNLSNLGAVYKEVGRSGDALVAYQEALQLADDRDLSASAVVIFNNLGVLHKARGELQLAMDSYARARELADRSGDLESMLRAAFNEGSLSRALGEPLRAVSLLEEALVLCRRLGSPMEGRVLQALGELAADNGDHGRALDFLEQAKLRSQAVGDRSGVAYAWYGIGRCRLELHDVGLARSALDAARKLQVELSDLVGLASTLRHLSLVELEAGEDERSRFFMEQALDLAQEIGDPSQESSVREQLALLLERDGDFKGARDELERSIEVVESLRSDLVSSELRATYFAKSHERYVRLARLLRRLDPTGLEWAPEAFALSERARARSLAERLHESQDRKPDTANPQLERSRRELRASLSAGQLELTRLLRSEDSRPSEIEAVRSKVAEIYRSLQELDMELRRADPRWATMAYPAPATVATAQGLLDRDTALLSYLLGSEESFLFVVTVDSIEGISLPRESELLPLMREMRALTETPGRRSLSRLARVSGELYSLLVAPAESLIGDRRQLVVIPDGGLHYIPFEALLVRDLAAGPTFELADSYLISRWGVSYVPSVSVWASLEERRRDVVAHDGYWVGFADPSLDGAIESSSTSAVLRGLADQGKWNWRRLAGARAEVDQIAKLFGAEESRVFTGDRANEELFKSGTTVERARYVHLASHALVDSRTPDLSAVLLAPSADGAEDGLLQAHEILDMRLSAELVVLSGCETALGREVRGEGLVGLTQAFLFAGARSVSVSLWPVEDGSTSELMRQFYSGLRGGQSSVDALRSAKLHQLASPATAHPYYWAPFVLMGAVS